MLALDYVLVRVVQMLAVHHFILSLILFSGGHLSQLYDWTFVWQKKGTKDITSTYTNFTLILTLMLHSVPSNLTIYIMKPVLFDRFVPTARVTHTKTHQRMRTHLGSNSKTQTRGHRDTKTGAHIEMMFAFIISALQ